MDTRETENAVIAVMAHVTRDRLLAAVTGLVDIASPTGREAPAATWIAETLVADGIDARVQSLDIDQANAVARLSGSGRGESLLLYAPIDTFTTGDREIDVPDATTRWRSDMEPSATVYGDVVQGLGAGNPKGHAAVIMVVMQALASSGIDLPGDVVAGFGAGGMPSFAVERAGLEGRSNTGHGVGAGFMLERGCTTDHAIVAKPGWTVTHEEVGLVWIDVTVPGLHTYVGSRHRLPYRNAAALAGRVAVALEDWLADYADRHEYASMKPQGVVASIHGGSERLAASTPAEVRMRLDLRLTTQQTPPQVVREVRAFLDGLAEQWEIEIGVEPVAAIPATETSPRSRVVRATVAAFEAVDGRRHQPIGQNSGATDANILRMRGVPTARVGMPKVLAGPNGEEVDFTRGMNLVNLDDMRRLAEVLIRSIFLIQDETLQPSPDGD